MRRKGSDHHKLNLTDSEGGEEVEVKDQGRSSSYMWRTCEGHKLHMARVSGKGEVREGAAHGHVPVPKLKATRRVNHTHTYIRLRSTLTQR